MNFSSRSVRASAETMCSVLPVDGVVEEDISYEAMCGSCISADIIVVVVVVADVVWKTSVYDSLWTCRCVREEGAAPADFECR